MCGIFGYYNYAVPRDLHAILDILFTGLKRLEYRGYDSAGICVDTSDAPSRQRSTSLDGALNGFNGAANGTGHVEANGHTAEQSSCPVIIKGPGKIENLEKLTEEYLQQHDLDTSKVFKHHVAISHTRWATHGPPSATNSHPHVSDPNADFAVVHNGIITNYKALKDILVSCSCVSRHL
eukprot:GHUV01024168.1.p1 GENE.GHUV01024168.1~~GHUV01024168.1.p1  ORF type:complete len:179 (+),score=39.97 GHUV01024168.1:279-815(+)